jgi:hypothetical protein
MSAWSIAAKPRFPPSRERGTRTVCKRNKWAEVRRRAMTASVAISSAYANARDRCRRHPDPCHSFCPFVVRQTCAAFSPTPGLVRKGECGDTIRSLSVAAALTAPTPSPVCLAFRAGPCKEYVVIPLLDSARGARDQQWERFADVLALNSTPDV